MIYWCYSDIFDCDEPLPVGPLPVDAAGEDEAAVRYAQMMLGGDDSVACPCVCVARSYDEALVLDGVHIEVQWSAKAVRR